MGNRTMGRRMGDWKTPDLSADWLKNFACVMMLLQAIGMVVFERGIIQISQYTQESLSEALAADPHLMTLAGISSILQLAGGMAVPVFAFLLVEGFTHTSDFKRYLLSLTVFALVSEIPYDLAWQGEWVTFSGQNALFTMVVCLLMLYFLDMIRSRKMAAAPFLYFLLVLAGALWTTLLRTQYGVGMVLLTAIFYLFQMKSGIRTLLGILVSLVYVTGPLSFYGIWCYTGVRKNRIPKYAYYLFYPLHLLVLWLAASVLSHSYFKL